tara:strand:+ start:12097 stop:14442 length:2346 start_codon:yes stop_codon:yes gene_type:complete
MKVSFFPLLLLSGLLLLGMPSLSHSQDQIRAVPIQAQEELFKFANLLYGNQNFEEAAPKYMRFLAEHPKSVNAPTAWYRLADCQRRLKNIEEAKKAFKQVLAIDPNGPFAGFAAYAMAVYTFNENKFDASLPYFRIATNKLKDPKINLESLFFYAQALQLAKSDTEAIKTYQAVLASKVPNDYRERAELELAKLQLAAGKKAEATQHFANLASSAKDPSIRDEATFKAGILGLDSDNPQKAEAFLLNTLKSPSSNPDFKAQAQLALILQANDRKDYEKVSVYYGAGPLGNEKTQSTAQMMLIAADAYRKLGKLAKAIEIYGKIESDQSFRKLPEGREAGFRKLHCFLEAGDPDIARWVDKYVENQSTIDPETPFIDLALLIKAERLYENKDYKNAAITYRNVRPGNIDPKYVPVRHYKMGWALIESGSEAQGLDILGEFANDWPEDPRVPSALVKRAMTFQAIENYEQSLSNYVALTKKFPSDPNTEYAMQQIALIHAQLRQIRPMVDAYAQLLKRFPNTAIKAEANYWIGGGLFDLKDYKLAIPALDQARKLKPEEFGPKATLRILLAHYHLDQLDELETETKAFLSMKTGGLKVPIQVFAHLGRKLFERGELSRARTFLERASNPSNPQKTPPDIWEKLFTIYLEQEKWDVAISSIDHFLIHEQHPVKRSQAMLKKAGAQLKLNQTEEAKAVGEEVLKLVRTGRANAEARILLGDIAMAEDDPKTAVNFYVIVAELGSDPVTVPEALSKLVTALRMLEETEKADSYEGQLKSRFPNYNS